MSVVLCVLTLLISSSLFDFVERLAGKIVDKIIIQTNPTILNYPGHAHHCLCACRITRIIETEKNEQKTFALRMNEEIYIYKVSQPTECNIRSPLLFPTTSGSLAQACSLYQFSLVELCSVY